MKEFFLPPQWRGLGLEPIGWIFTYKGNRHTDDALPVYANDVVLGAKLQIENMKKDRENGKRFATLAMDGASGATEAFQLSDVCVQMVADGTLDEGAGPNRMSKTRRDVIVDSQQTVDLDSVLCLVNTAVLSHIGMFSGKSASLKKNGLLSKSTRKAIESSLASHETLWNELCNFQTLLGLAQAGLGEQSLKELCNLLKKRSRGHRKGTILSSKLSKEILKLVRLE